MAAPATSAAPMRPSAAAWRCSATARATTAWAAVKP